MIKSKRIRPSKNVRSTGNQTLDLAWI